MRGQHVANPEPNDAFGEWTYAGEIRSARLICNNDSILIEIERQHLLPLLKEQPGILENMGSTMARRRKTLNANKEQRAMNRRLTLIGSMLRLCNLSNQAQ